MSITHIPTTLRRLVVERAGNRCEYCLLPAEAAFFPHEVDHVIAEKHGGKTEAENLVFACWRCNRHKGSDLGSFEPQTQIFSLLFNPRRESLERTFCLSGRGDHRSDTGGSHHSQFTAAQQQRASRGAAQLARLQITGQT